MKRMILALLTGAAFAASSPAYAAVKTIVLVHGAFADGSGWKPVADKQKPSYAVISKQDRMINPDLEFMAKRAQSQAIELPGSHAIFLSHAHEVAALIEKAATAPK
jgi:hypothetical protein